MTAETPLQGLELIDCAKANASQGIESAIHLCGYGTDANAFQQALQQACQDIGVEFHEFSDLVTNQQTIRKTGGIEIAPESSVDF